MTITDGPVEEPVRQTYLSFGEAESGPLGFMVEDEALRPALEAAARGAGVGFEPSGLASFEAREDRIDLVFGTGERRSACLLVGADGARSRLRDAAGIPWFGRAYPQAGIVATVRHRHPHRGRAIQHFLPEGPFAILPLVDGPDGTHRSSIVWTEKQARIAEVLALEPEVALDAVAARVGRNLDPVSLDTPLAAFPLGFGLARSFVAPRFALLGDSAHEIHPLAGQGLNLGLGDAAALAERIADAVRLGIDPGSPDVLSAYERDRRFDAVALAGVTDGLNRLFSNDVLPVRALRDFRARPRRPERLRQGLLRSRSLRADGANPEADAGRAGLGAHQRSPGSSHDCPAAGAGTPRWDARVAPISASVGRSPMDAGRDAGSEGEDWTCSRVWSVPRKVGSLPWSAVHDAEVDRTERRPDLGDTDVEALQAAA
jgi:2-octaprenyl-6-methoxyphenol hydroxylase